MDKVEFSFKGVHFIDNIYVIKEHAHSIEYDKEIDGAQKKAEEELEKVKKDRLSKCVISDEHDDYTEVELFGGRITIRSDLPNYNLRIDGIQIFIFEDDLKKTEKFNVNLFVSLLNSTAVYGLDEFLTNYKNSIKNYIKELESHLNLNLERYQTSEGNESLRKSFIATIEKLKESLIKILSVLFLLEIHNPMGIENEKIMEVMEKVDTIFGYI